MLIMHSKESDTGSGSGGWYEEQMKCQMKNTEKRTTAQRGSSAEDAAYQIAKKQHILNEGYREQPKPCD